MNFEIIHTHKLDEMKIKRHDQNSHKIKRCKTRTPLIGRQTSMVSSNQKDDRCFFKHNTTSSLSLPHASAPAAQLKMNVIEKQVSINIVNIVVHVGKKLVFKSLIIRNSCYVIEVTIKLCRILKYHTVFQRNQP